MGIGLVASALVLAVVALLLWQGGTDNAEADQLAEDYRAAIAGGPAEDINADRTAPTALGAVSAVLVIAGTVVLASPSHDS